ncbi:MAG TPA: hypothetical protein VIV82_06685 [Verrucomicrobiae bacterium]
MVKHLFPYLSVRCLSAAVLAGLWSSQAHAQYNPDWARNFRVGVLTGFNINADFRMNGNFGVSGRPGATGVPGVNHNYSDGYVRVDDTGNAGGYTTYWGYENADQYDSVNQTLQMHSITGFSTSSKGEADDDSPYIGFDLAYGGMIWRGERLRVGWEFGFGMLPITLTQNSTLRGPISGNTYEFSVPNGVIPPGAPYHGGSSGYDQPSINDIATLVGSTTAEGTISGTRTLDVTLYAFRLGPSLFWDLNRSFGLSLSAGPALGFVSGEYRYDEIIDDGQTEERQRGKFTASDIVFGGYVNGILTYHATQNGDLYISAQYMPLGSPTFSKGGRHAELDLSGAIYLSAGVSWPF